MADRELAIVKVKQLMEGGHLPSILDEICDDLAKATLRTHPDQVNEREDLYMLARAVKCLNVKLQEYVNTFDSIQEK